MKVLYSQIKKFVPELKASPKETAKALTLIGFMRDGFEKVTYKGKDDYLISLEVRHNRGDCLSVFGIAKEVAAYYNLKTKLPKVDSISASSKSKLEIKPKANDYIKRILAVKIKGLKNKSSPKWLKKLLKFHGINSVNLLVDLSNYAMILSGYPSHILDMSKTQGNITWAENNSFDEITTLDNSDVKLNGNELIIRDNKNILALAGIIGGKAAKVDLETNSIIVEMAIYDHSKISNDSRSLNIRTEASNRLTKDLDPNGSLSSFNLLVSLILKNCGGTIKSKIFDYYPKEYTQPEIKFNPATPSIYSGIDIKKEKSINILKNLGFKIRKKDQNFLVTPPVNRTDVSIEEDLIEEVVRMVGYDKIPSQETPELKVVKEITPSHIKLIEKVKDILFSLGFDEILSLPLIKKGQNKKINYLDWEMVVTQNSVNENYPELRQSIVAGLINQLEEYIKKNVKHIKIFEIGKVFGKKKQDYKEHDSLGILLANVKDLSVIKSTIEKLLRSIGLVDIRYVKAKDKPKVANPHSCWDITINKERIGVIYKLKPKDKVQNVYFAEVNLQKATSLLRKISKKTTVVELTHKLVVLDANVELEKDKSVYNFLEEVKKKIGDKHILSTSIIDKFPLDEKVRYTIRVSYKGLRDQETKKIHLDAFDLAS